MLLFSLLLSLGAYAAWDSVGVFHRPDKVVVLLNEHRPAGHPDEKLHGLFESLGAGNQLQFLSADQGIKIECARGDQQAGCTFRFLPANNVKITPRQLRAVIALADLKTSGVQTAGEGVDVTFNNSNGDQFHIWTDETQLHMHGSKKDPTR